MKDLPQISKAILTKIRWKLGLLTEIEKQEIIKRRQLCWDCPLNSINAIKRGVYSSDRVDLHCSECGCVIDLLTACLDCNCSIEKINQRNKTNIPLKWYSLIQ